MEHINGQNNEFTFIFPNNRIDCLSSQDKRFCRKMTRALALETIVS